MGRPEHFFRHLMLFKQPVGFQHPMDIQVDMFETWIQCHNLPLTCMTLAVVRSVGERIGRVLEIDVNEGWSCIGQFARVRVLKLIMEPLLRCMKIEQKGTMKERVALIRYEKLSEFCSACGRVGHGARHCVDESVDKEACTFGPWLRAGRVRESRRGRNALNDTEQADDKREVSGRSKGSSSEAGSTAEGAEGGRTVDGPLYGQGGEDAGVKAVEKDTIIVHPLVGLGMNGVYGNEPSLMGGCSAPLLLQEKTRMEIDRGDDMGMDNHEQEEKGTTRLVQDAVGLETKRDMARGVEAKGDAGGMDTGVAERRWKRRVRGARQLGGEGELGGETTSKWKMSVGAEELPVMKLPRREHPSENGPVEALMNITAAAAKQSR